jgi:hypothetical protein
MPPFKDDQAKIKSISNLVASLPRSRSVGARPGLAASTVARKNPLGPGLVDYRRNIMAPHPPPPIANGGVSLLAMSQMTPEQLSNLPTRILDIKEDLTDKFNYRRKRKPQEDTPILLTPHDMIEYQKHKPKQSDPQAQPMQQVGIPFPKYSPNRTNEVPSKQLMMSQSSLQQLINQLALKNAFQEAEKNG